MWRKFLLSTMMCIVLKNKSGFVVEKDKVCIISSCILDNGGNNKSKRTLKKYRCIIMQTLKKTCKIIFLNSC